jgi:hypothetical protein
MLRKCGFEELELERWQVVEHSRIIPLWLLLLVGK